MFNEKEGQTNYCQQCEELQAQYNAAQERIRQFDKCIRAVADALNAPACGGVDTDIEDPYGTTAVLVGRAKELADRVRKADDRVRVLTDALSSRTVAGWLRNGHDFIGLPEQAINSDIPLFTLDLVKVQKAYNATPQQTANDDEVLGCPFCGSTDISDGEALIGKDDGTTSVQSQCLACGAFGPESPLEQGEIDFGDVKARAAWNRRVPAQQIAEQIERDYMIVGEIVKDTSVLRPVYEDGKLVNPNEIPSKPQIYMQYRGDSIPIGTRLYVIPPLPKDR